MGWRGRLSRAVAGASERSPLRLLGPLRSRLVGTMTAGDVVEVVRALEAAGLPYWLVGGWGVDALAGRLTRRHDDLDVVLERFGEDAERACAALAPLGFRVVGRERSEVVLPDRLLLADGGRRSVDLVSLDPARLDAALDALGPPGRGDDLRATGTIADRTVPCASETVQRALRSTYAPRPVDRHDLRVLSARRARDGPGTPTTGRRLPSS